MKSEDTTVYRLLGISDLALVLRMGKDFRPGFICERNAAAFLSDPMNRLFVCLEGDRVVAFAYGYELKRLNDIGNMLYIHEVGVLPGYRRRGIGKRLLEELKALCTLLGVCRIFLFTQRSNTAACALYKTLGGKAAHEDDVAYFFELGGGKAQ